MSLRYSDRRLCCDGFPSVGCNLVRYHVIILFDFQEALADEQRLNKRYENDIEIARAQRDFELASANYEQDIQTCKAQAELAYSLQVWISVDLVILVILCDFIHISLGYFVVIFILECLVIVSI